MAPVATHTEAPEKVEQLTLDGVAKELGPVAHRFSVNTTAAIQAFLWRTWPRHPKRVGVVIYALTMMGGRGFTNESAPQIGAALRMSPGVIRNHLAAACCEGILASHGKHRGRRLTPGVVLVSWLELHRRELSPRAPELSPPEVTLPIGPHSLSKSVESHKRVASKPTNEQKQKRWAPSDSDPGDGQRQQNAIGLAAARQACSGLTRAISDSCCGRRRTRPSAPPAPPLPRTRGTGPGPRSRPAP